MADQYWLSEAQLERIKPPTWCRRPHVISGIVQVIRKGLRWRDAPEVTEPL